MRQLIAEFVKGRGGPTAGDIERCLDGHPALDPTGDNLFTISRYLFLARDG